MCRGNWENVMYKYGLHCSAFTLKEKMWKLPFCIRFFFLLITRSSADVGTFCYVNIEQPLAIKHHCCHSVFKSSLNKSALENF